MDIQVGKKYFNKIVIGFIFHLLGGVVSSTLGNDILQALVCLVGWFFIAKGVYGLRKELRNPFKGAYNTLFYFYIWLCVVMIIRGYLIDYPYQWLGMASFVNFHLFSPTYILCYLMPVVAYIPSRYYSFSTMLKYSIWGYLFFIIVFVVFFDEIVRSSIQAELLGGFEQDSPILALSGLGISFMLLCWKYMNKRQFYIILIGSIVQLLAFLICARRGAVAIKIYLFFVLAWTYYSRKSFGIKLSLIAVFVGIAVALIGYYNESAMFGFIRERGLEDTRTGVEDAMLSQMSVWQQIFGEGLNGRYYYPMGFDIDIYNGWRYGIETGFYNIVLKGGYLMAFTYIILLLIPALKGIFKSNNLLCKVGGYFIFLSLLELYPHGWLSFSVRFLIIWMSIALCMSRQMRNMSDQQIYEHFFAK